MVTTNKNTPNCNSFEINLFKPEEELGTNSPIPSNLPISTSNSLVSEEHTAAIPATTTRTILVGSTSDSSDMTNTN